MTRLAAAERRPEWVGGTRPSAPTYIGSRHVEVEAMLREVNPSLSDVLTYPAVVATRARGAVAVDARYVASRQVGVGADPLRADLDAVEHVRQNRLRSWQKPADTGHRR